MFKFHSGKKSQIQFLRDVPWNLGFELWIYISQKRVARKVTKFADNNESFRGVKTVQRVAERSYDTE